MADEPPPSDRIVLVPGPRDVRGTLDGPPEPESIVVACPPHPEHGGNRRDPKLRAVGDALAECGVGCLRIDYGPWDGGDGESEDVRNAVRWARDRAERVSIFGYSFGGSLSLVVAGSIDEPVAAVSALAPTARLGSALDVVEALDDLSERTALQVLFGSRDDTVEWEPVVARARVRDAVVVELSGDHFFVGQESKIAAHVGAFLAGESGE